MRISFIACSIKIILDNHRTRLELAHRRFDEAVFAAYGRKPDRSDEEILERAKPNK